MVIRSGHILLLTRRVDYVILLWICIICVKAKTYDQDDLSRNGTHFEGKDSFTQKKPRSAQYGFMPRLQAMYPRQNMPVRLATIPVNGGYRIPITGGQRLTNIAPLARLPSLQRTAYVPIYSTAPSYPLIRQGGLASPRYIVPYALKMPTQRLPATNQATEDLGKHYNEKYNSLPTISNMDMEQDGLNLRKSENKKLDIGDEFDNFLESLDGPCSKNPCKNGAKCRISRSGISFHCICKRGYKGKTCEDKNACFPNPCQNNGECTLTNEGFECSCPKEFKGKKCEQANTCEPNPCENDGVCTELKNGGFECTCKKGHFGNKCQVSKRGCNPNPCRNNGQCTEKGNGGYECTCAEGYTGTKCDRPNNKCFTNPCKNGGSCMQAMTSLGYECACTRGFRGSNCEDHSGCDMAACQNGGTCYETEFGVRCICRNGYSGDKCQIRKFCEADTCQNNGKCIEHVNGFRCVCSEGYKGKMCDEIDRCRPSPCQNGAHCEQSDSGYFCKCSSQYQGRNCEVSNPCSSGPCKNGGKCSSGLVGQLYQCQCLDGYQGTNCEERNECAPNPCGNNGVCRKNGADFVCECRDGFEGKTCREKDPCKNSPCQNNGVCKRNGNDDFTCSCPGDYKGTRCEVKRHCRPNPCMNNGVCEESDDDFTCLCKQGFRGQRCDELDQCAPNPCKNGGRCVSVGIQGNGRAYVCECANSFFGDTCEERNPCHPSPCGNGGQCTEINGGFTCQCSAGYKGDRCHEIDKCSPSPCQHQGSCTEVIGGLGYACKCAYGYKGQDCEKKDYCRPNPCDHEGQCMLVDNETGYQCKCAPGFMGQRCSDSNPCEPNPCEHSSQCVLLPGFGKNHECNCSIGWSGNTCQKREICHPNPCQYGTKCVETGDDSYSCVKSMCHPNPCENEGKCINVNQDNFQCACTADFEGQRCQGDDISTNLDQTTNQDKSNRASIERHTTADDEPVTTIERHTTGNDEPVTTNIDDLLQLVDNTLNAYKSKHKHENTNKVTSIRTLSEVTNKETNKLRPSRLDEDDKTNDDDIMTTHERDTKRRNDITKHTIIDENTNEKPQNTNENPQSTNENTHNTNENPQNTNDDPQNTNEIPPNTNDNSDIMRLDDELIKSLNPQGEVIVDNSQQKTMFSEQPHKELRVNYERQNDTTKQAVMNENTNKNSVITKLDEEVIKSLNPQGEVVVENSKQPTKEPTIYFEQNTKPQNDLTNHVTKNENTNKSPQNTNKNLKNTNDNLQNTNENLGNTNENLGNTNENLRNTNENLQNTNENLQNTNENRQNTNDNSDVTKLDEKFIKSLNSQGEVIVDTKQPTKDSPGVDRDDIQNNLMTNLQTNLNQTEFEDSMLNSIPDEEALIKSINPAGGVVVDSKVPRKPSQLSLVPTSPPSLYPQISPTLPASTPPTLQLTKSSPLVNGPDLKSGKPPRIPMSTIASCSPFLCQNGGVCVQEVGKSIRCKCTPMYTGETCNLNKCHDNPCQNKGTCLPVEREPGFVCKCRDGHTGPLCSRKPCDPNPCKNNGQCVMFYSIYLCKCKTGFRGKLCEDNMGTAYNDNEMPLQTDSNNYNNEQENTNNINEIKVNDNLMEYSNGPNFDLKNSNSNLPQTTTTAQDNSQLLGQTTPKPTEQTYVLVPSKDMLRNRGSEILLTSNKMSDLNSNIVLPNADLNAKTDQFTQFGQDLGAIDANANINIPLESTTGSVVTTGTGTENIIKEKAKPTSPALIMKNNQALSPCNPSPCKNNAQCVETSDGEFECICSQDFSGPRCEDNGENKYSSARKFFPGENEECKHCDKNARCVNGHCVCKNKYVGDGLECWQRTQKDIDWKCSVNPCKNGGTCKVGISACVCRLGFVGDLCEEFSPPVVHLNFDKLSGNRVMDMSGNGNDAMIHRGFQIAPKQGKCDSAGSLLGGDVIFDGEHFKGIPRRAITMTVWVKLTTALGIQSIFDTIGSHSKHKEGQYHFEIDNGRVRWFHRNEDAKTVFSVVTDQIVVREGNWTLVTGTYSADKNRARIYVNGDMMKEEPGHNMALSGDWGLKAGIATLPELDIPTDELDYDTITENNNDYKNNLMADMPSLTNNKLNFLLLKTVKNDNENSISDKNDNNKGYIEKILNKDKEKLNGQYGSTIYAVINNNRLKNIRNNKDYTIDNINENSNIDFNDQNNNKIDDNLMILNNKRIRRDGKHEHPYGARVLRGMVDEFSIFPSELSRLQILVLMTHCKVYYNKNIKKTSTTSTAFGESFTEMKSYAPTGQPFTQPAGSYVPQSSYYQGQTNVLTTPQPSSNVPPTYSYYGNNGYQPSTNREQAGYQRSQGYKRPSTNVPKQSTYVTGSPSFIKESPSYVKQLPSYVPESPSYTQGSSRTGIPATAYKTSYTPTRTNTYPYNPEVRQGNGGYAKSYTLQSPVTQPYNPQWSGSRQDQLAYVRTRTPGSPVNYRGPSYNPQYQQNTREYNGYATRRNQAQSRFYSQGGIYTGNDVTPTGSRSQGPGYVRNRQYSPVTSNTAYNTMQYRTAPANAALEGNRYSDIPQRATRTQYNPAQYAGNIPSGQYRFIAPAGGRQSGQYGPQVNVQNSAYSAGIKNIIPQNSYQGNQNPMWGNDVTGKITSPGDVTRASYANDFQSRTQNAYPRNDVYANDFKNFGPSNGYNPPVSRQYTSSYATPSITPEYGPSYAYTGIDHAVRANIPKPISPRVNQKSRPVHVTTKNKAQSQKLRQNAHVQTRQGQLNGPLQNKNKLSRINKLDENGQYPSDMKRYQYINAQTAGIRSPGYTGVKQPAYTRNSNSWSTRTQTPTSGRVAKMGSYDRWSARSQTQKPGRLWNSGPKVDEAVKYNDGTTSQTTSQTTATATNAGNKAPTKDIDIDNVVQKALTDFLTTHILRKRKRRKREDAKHERENETR